MLCNLVVSCSSVHVVTTGLWDTDLQYAGWQEESDAQYKNKGKKGSKADTKSTADAASKADPAPAAESGTSIATSAADAEKDVEMTDAPSTSEEKKHVGEMTGY